MEGPAATVLGPAPRLVKAMAQYRQGRQADARKTLAAAVLCFDWQRKPDHRDIWIFHILRREAEMLILPKLHAFLQGKCQARDNNERLALVEGCLYLNRTSAAAQLYADALAADPHLADDLSVGHRYQAARSAALAGSGRGDDAKDLGDRERARWRAQARQWLRAELTAWEKELDRTPAAAGRCGRYFRNGTATGTRLEFAITATLRNCPRRNAPPAAPCGTTWTSCWSALKKPGDIKNYL